MSWRPSKEQKAGWRKSAYQRAKEADPEGLRRVRRGYKLKFHYGITLADEARMLSSQGGLCASCRDTLATHHVDHCHATGKVRGLLCAKCNKGLGLFLDDPARLRAAAEYLERTCST